MYIASKLIYRSVRIRNLEQLRMAQDVILRIARQTVRVLVQIEPLSVFQVSGSNKRHGRKRYASTSCSAVGYGRWIDPPILLVLRPFKLRSHSTSPRSEVCASCRSIGALLNLDRGYLNLVAIRCSPSGCPCPLDYLCIGHRASDRYRDREAVSRDGLVILVRDLCLIAFVDDIQFLVADSVVDAYLTILPFRDNVPYIEFDSLVLLIHLDVPHDAPKHSALIEIYLYLLSAVYDLEPIYRQNECRAWGKHEFVLKRDGIKYLLAPYY